MKESELAIFQASLLEILSTQSEPTQIAIALHALSAPDEMAEYIATFDPKMVRLAAHLVQQWGRR